MRMMCVRGKQHPAHTGVVAGQVYDVDIVQAACGCTNDPRALAQGSVFKRKVKLDCIACKKVCWYGGMVPWGPDRFVKWDDPKVGEKEVRELYAAPPKKEAIDG